MRTIEQIQQEYLHVCAQAGEIRFNMEVALPRALSDLHIRIAELKAEADEVAKAAAEAKPEEK